MVYELFPLDRYMKNFQEIREIKKKKMTEKDSSHVMNGLTLLVNRIWIGQNLRISLLHFEASRSIVINEIVSYRFGGVR